MYKQDSYALSCSLKICFAMCSLNNLAVIGNDKFYFSNDRKYCFYMELMFRLAFGSIGFYNGSHAKLLEENLFIPLGLAVSDDHKYAGHSAYLHHILMKPF